VESSTLPRVRRGPLWGSRGPSGSVPRGHDPGGHPGGLDPARPRSEGTYFTSLEAARKVLTPKRLELLRVIRQGRPDSVYQLARLVGRDFKNVHADVQALAAYGLVSLKKAQAGRRTSVPRVPFSTIEFRIAV